MPLKPGIYKGKILVLHGADDPIVPDDQTIASGMRCAIAKANWEFVAYGGAPHLYKSADAGGRYATRRLQQTGYRRPWIAMQNFFNRRWCSDGFKIGCDNGEPVRVAFALA